MHEYYTRYQLEDGAWISQTEKDIGDDDAEGPTKRVLASQIDAAV
jgi:hypothetical protein